jgi:hypothetical protein
MLSRTGRAAARLAAGSSGPLLLAASPLVLLVTLEG